MPEGASFAVKTRSVLLTRTALDSDAWYGKLGQPNVPTKASKSSGLLTDKPRNRMAPQSASSRDSRSLFFDTQSPACEQSTEENRRIAGSSSLFVSIRARSVMGWFP